MMDKIKAMLNVIESGRRQSIEAHLEFAFILREARELLPNDEDFNRWLEQHGLPKISPEFLKRIRP